MKTNIITITLIFILVSACANTIIREYESNLQLGMGVDIAISEAKKLIRNNNVMVWSEIESKPDEILSMCQAQWECIPTDLGNKLIEREKRGLPKTKNVYVMQLGMFKNVKRGIFLLFERNNRTIIGIIKGKP